MLFLILPPNNDIKQILNRCYVQIYQQIYTQKGKFLKLNFHR